MCFRPSPFPMLITREVASQPRQQQLVANCTSQHYLHIIDVPASCSLLCSGSDLWFEEDFTRIFRDIKTQKHQQTSVIANQDSFARHCRLYSCLYDQDICITLVMTCLASNVFQALTLLDNRSSLLDIVTISRVKSTVEPALPPVRRSSAPYFLDSPSWYPSNTIMACPYLLVTGLCTVDICHCRLYPAATVFGAPGTRHPIHTGFVQLPQHRIWLSKPR